MIHTLATKLLTDLIDMHDKIDFTASHYGTGSVEWLDAFEIYIDHFEYIHKLICLGLAQDL